MKIRLKVVLFIFSLALLQGGFLVTGDSFIIDGTNNAVKHNEQGVRFLNEQDYWNAVQEFKIAIKLTPDSAASATFYNNLGLAYLALVKYDWAQECFERAVMLNPNFLQYYENLVKIYKIKGELRSSVTKYRKLISHDKSNSKAWLLLGLIYRQLGQNKEAVNCLNEFKKLEPDLLITEGVTNIISTLK